MAVTLQSVECSPAKKLSVFLCPGQSSGVSLHRHDWITGHRAVSRSPAPLPGGWLACASNHMVGPGDHPILSHVFTQAGVIQGFNFNSLFNHKQLRNSRV